jgi:uncharacterized membrane protein
MTPLAIAVVSSAAYVGSGAAQFKNGAWIIAGIGDLINTMITAAIAVLDKQSMPYFLHVFQ